MQEELSHFNILQETFLKHFIFACIIIRASRIILAAIPNSKKDFTP